MIGPRAKGGLGMPDFDITNNALKPTWIRRLVSSYLIASWLHIPVTLLEQVGGLFLLKCNFDLDSYLCSISTQQPVLFWCFC